MKAPASNPDGILLRTGLGAELTVPAKKYMPPICYEGGACKDISITAIDYDGGENNHTGSTFRISRRGGYGNNEEAYVMLNGPGTLHFEYLGTRNRMSRDRSTLDLSRTGLSADRIRFRPVSDQCQTSVSSPMHSPCHSPSSPPCTSVHVIMSHVRFLDSHVGCTEVVSSCRMHRSLDRNS